MGHQKERTARLTVMSLMLAILIIQTFVPGIGYIPIGPVQATIIHLTVIIGASLFGPQTGLILGASWGVLRMIKAAIVPDIMSVVFLNPLVSVMPRMLVGLVSGWLAMYLDGKVKDRSKFMITGLIGSMINTLTVLGAIYLFSAEAYANALNIPSSALMATFLVTIGGNGLIEAITSGVLTPILALPLSKSLKRSRTV
ncbi:ECF transporter S component [Aerococcaceae bacterium 50-4]